MAAAAKKSAKKAATKTSAKTTTAPKAAAAPAPEPAPVVHAAPASSDSFVPIVDRSPWGILALVLGIVGLGGVGTIIAGVKDGRHKGRDITIGVLQIVILFAGSVWGLVWGILIFVKGNK